MGIHADPDPQHWFSEKSIRYRILPQINAYVRYRYSFSWQLVRVHYPLSQSGNWIYKSQGQF
jgi:hypothetical protein